MTPTTNLRFRGRAYIRHTTGLSMHGTPRRLGGDTIILQDPCSEAAGFLGNFGLLFGIWLTFWLDLSLLG